MRSTPAWMWASCGEIYMKSPSRSWSQLLAPDADLLLFWTQYCLLMPRILLGTSRRDQQVLLQNCPSLVRTGTGHHRHISVELSTALEKRTHGLSCRGWARTWAIVMKTPIRYEQFPTAKKKEKDKRQKNPNCLMGYNLPSATLVPTQIMRGAI